MPRRFLAPVSLAQQPAYQPPRTANGHPDLAGVWGASFMTFLERPTSSRQLVLSPDEAREAAARQVADTPDLIDPDFFIQNINTVLSVRGEFRSSLLVTPADGHMPYTEKGLKLVERSFWMDEQADDNPEERTTFDRCLAGLGQPPIRQIPAMMPNTFRPDTARNGHRHRRRRQYARRPPRWIASAAGRDDIL